MPIQEFNGFSNRSLRLGPEQNTFEGTDLANAGSIRDSYFSSNPSKLAIYDANSSLMIRLAYTTVDGSTVKFMVRIAGAWVDYTPVVQGLPGEVASLVGVPIGEIPYKLIDGTFGGSNMRVLEDGRVLAPPGFTVESGSVTFGEAITLSEISGFLGISNHLNNREYTVVDFYTPPDAISSPPTIFHLIEPAFEFVAQSNDSTNLPDNPLIFNYTVQNTARSRALKFRTYAAMTNVRMKISLVSNGVVLKHIPSQQAWEESTGGLNWTLGDNTYSFGDTSLNLQTGDQLHFELRADNVALKGNNLGVPYFSAMIQRGQFRDVITDAVYTASDIKTKLESLISPNKLSKTAIQDSVLSVNSQYGDVLVTTTSIGAQPLDATLTALASQVTAADGLTYSTGVDTFAQTQLTPFARTILDDTSDSAVRSTLGLGNAATRNVDVPNGIATLDGSGKLTQMPTKSDVGLGNVDNTSDVNKPTSTAQQASINAAIAAHNAAPDPHPQYTTTAEASAAAPVQSVAGKTGTVTLNTSDVSEGTNLYYTDSRVGSYLSTNGYNVKSIASSGGGSSVFNSNTSGAVTLRSIIVTGAATGVQNANDITINVPAAPVQSVNGFTGTVVLNTSNIAENTNLYYTDARVGTYLVNNGYTVKSVNNIGTGANIFSNTTSGVVSLRSLVQGGGVTITQNTNDVTISTPVITDGTYTPTLFNTTNVSASTSGICMYTRIGNTVRVAGSVQIDPTNNNQSTVLGVSLPIASNFTASTDCAGSGAAADVAGQSCGILADPVNDRALIQFVNGSATNHSMYFSFTYKVQ